MQKLDTQYRRLYKHVMQKRGTYKILTVILLFAFMSIPANTNAQQSLTQRLLNFNPTIEKPQQSLRESPRRTNEISDGALKTYTQIFTLQDNADWKRANTLIATLQDRRLMGYVLKQRYLHPTGYVSTYEELRQWMERYRDHAGARDIYNLALKKRRRGNTERLLSPVNYKISHRYSTGERTKKALYSRNSGRSQSQYQNYLSLRAKVIAKVKDERPTQAYGILNAQRKKLTRLDYNRLKARISSSYMHEGKDKTAQRLAKEVITETRNKIPTAAWVVGLTSWRQRNYAQSAKFFQISASSPYSSAWMKSGSAYWASRAHMRVGNFKAVSLWLNKAADEPRTFYGLIAQRALSKPLRFEWKMPRLSVAERRMISNIPAGARAVGLSRLGYYEQAAHEFEALEVMPAPNLRRALMKLSEQVNQPGMAWRNASYLMKERVRDIPLSALYPTMYMPPERSYKIDRALLHAIIRQESRFNRFAGSSVGAQGMMQLMPATAKHVIGFDGDLSNSDFNIRTGQKYLHELFDHYTNGNNMFQMLIAWNAGPGKLNRWQREMGATADPLLFIESIPVGETRAFIEHVMANYWLYRNRFGQPTPSLDAVAEGRWPVYREMD